MFTKLKSILFGFILFINAPSTFHKISNVYFEECFQILHHNQNDAFFGSKILEIYYKVGTDITKQIYSINNLNEAILENCINITLQEYKQARKKTLVISFSTKQEYSIENNLLESTLKDYSPQKLEASPRDLSPYNRQSQLTSPARISGRKINYTSPKSKHASPKKESALSPKNL